MKSLKTLILAVLFAGMISGVFAQDFKLAIKSANKVKIIVNAGSYIIEGYSGKELQIDGPDSKIPEEARGLQLINGGGLNDNTGVGLNVDEADGVISIKNIGKSGTYTIKVPENMNLQVTAKTYNAGKINISNFKSELEVKSEYASVNLNDVTGPVVLNVTYGKAKANFSNVNQEKPISIISTYGNVDVTIPASTKAKLSLESTYGNIYSDMPIAYDKKTSDNEGWEHVGKNVSGTVNGGGVEIYLKSPYSNIYLRKK